MRFLDSPGFAGHREELEGFVADCVSGRFSQPDSWKALGSGFCATVYGFGTYALKLYQPNKVGLPVPLLMRREIDTYRSLRSSGLAAMPSYFDHHEVPAGRDQHVCGWLLMSAAPGRTFDLTEVNALGAGSRERWICALVERAVELEDALASSAAPSSDWQENYADVRVRRITELHRAGRVHGSDLTMSEELDKIIKSEGGVRRYIHGDFNPPNLVTNIETDGSGRIDVKLIDPLINFDDAEANWRHFTMIPELAEELARAYADIRGSAANLKLLYALGALTHLFMSIVLQHSDAAEAAKRRRALEVCLERLTC